MRKDSCFTPIEHLRDVVPSIFFPQLFFFCFFSLSKHFTLELVYLSGESGNTHISSTCSRLIVLLLLYVIVLHVLRVNRISYIDSRHSMFVTTARGLRREKSNRFKLRRSHLVGHSLFFSLTI